MVVGELRDLTTICSTFPRINSESIGRENIVQTIEDLLDSDVEVVTVYAEEGKGKTTLLAEFAKAHPDQTFSLFIKSTSRWGYDSEFLRRDLCNQLNWVTKGTELPENVEVSESMIRNYWTSLRRSAKPQTGVFYFVVDGLEDIPSHESHHRELLLSMLPFGLSRFRFIISTVPKSTISIPVGVKTKAFCIPNFSFDESSRVLSKYQLERAVCKELHEIARGVPGKLASIVRILESGYDVQKLIEEMPTRFPDFFEIEWRLIETWPRQKRLILALLAFDRRAYPITEISRLLRQPTDQIKEDLATLPFIEIRPDSESATAFSSETFRAFAADKLADLREEINAAVIDDLLANPESDRSLSRLPVYLRQAGKLEKLLDYLSPDHFALLLNRSQSLAPIRSTVLLGFSAADELHRDADLMRFSLHRSTISELETSDVGSSEIEARMSLGDSASALALAQAASMKEDRLQLLAVIARKKREQGLAPEPELLEQIKLLFSQLDFSTLGDRAVDIASDLIAVAPELAIEMVEKATNNRSDQGSVDAAFTKLSISALTSQQSPHGHDTMQRLEANVKDPRTLRFLRATTLLVRDYSADAVIQVANKLESGRESIFFLRQWCIKNRKRDDAYKVVEFAIELVIHTTSYTPNARDFRELISPLPYIKDRVAAEKLVQLLDAHRASIQLYGPTVESVRFQLTLIETELPHNFESARNRVADAYYFITNIRDLADRTECLARLHCLLLRIDTKGTLEQSEGCQAITESDLKCDFQQLLVQTAEHYEVSRGLLRALAAQRLDLAIEFALALNIEPRRDLALFEIIKAIVQGRRENFQITKVQTALYQIKDSRIYAGAIGLVFEGAADDTELKDDKCDMFLPFIVELDKIEGAIDRTSAALHAYQILRRGSAACAGAANHVLAVLTKSWGLIDVGWKKVSMAFEIAASLSTIAIEHANRFLLLAEQSKSDTPLQDGTTAWTYVASLQLAVASYAGLLLGRFDKKEDLDQLETQILMIPSLGERAKIWIDLCCRFFLSGRIDEGKKHVLDKLRPLLEKLSKIDRDYWVSTYISASPALYTANPVLTIEELNAFPPLRRDEAVDNIVDFILQKSPPYEPFDAPDGYEYDITYDDVSHVISLLQIVERDGLIYSIVERICDAIESRKLRDRLSAQQKTAIAVKMELLFKGKFPNPRYIQHEGYSILCQAQLFRTQRRQIQDWFQLVESGKRIPNLADRAFVLLTLGRFMPNKDPSKRREIFNAAKEIVDQIPSLWDQISHRKSLAAAAWQVDSSFARGCLSIAMKFSADADDAKMYQMQRDIVDFAHRFDPDFAATLVSSNDTDPARIQLRQRLTAHLKTLDIKKEMLEKPSNEPTMEMRSQYPKAAWKHLGSLNSGRHQPRHLEQMRSYIRVAAELPLSESYPIIAWTIANATYRYRESEQAHNFLGPLFEATLLACKVTSRMATRTSVSAAELAAAKATQIDSASVIVAAGDREKSLKYLRKWLEGAKEYLKICDPYFGVEDLEILRWILELSLIRHLRCRYLPA